MNSSTKAVIQLISSDGVYGAEQVVLNLARYFAAQGSKSFVVAIDCPGADHLLQLARDSGLSTWKLRAAGRPLWSTLRELREFVVREHVDVVHAHGYKADTLVHWASLRKHARLVSTCHTWYSDSLRMKFYEYLDKRALRHFDHVVVVSPQLLEDVVASGVDAGRVSMIRNGTVKPATDEGARDRVRREFGFTGEDFVLVRIGRLAASKGNELLLRAIASQALPPTTRLLFAGDGEERESLAALARECGLAERVKFAGYRQDIGNLLAASDLFVLPSLKEGLPMVLLEAMAAGIPIVSSDAGAIGTVLQSGHNAWVVPAGDGAALGGALAQACTDATRRARFATQAQQDFQRRYSNDIMGGAYLRVYAGDAPGAHSLPAVAE